MNKTKTGLILLAVNVLCVGSYSAVPQRFDLDSLKIANGGDGTKGFVIAGGASNDRLGQDVAVGDFNGDGISDIVASMTGLQNNTFNAEQIVVFLGGTNLPATEYHTESYLQNAGGDGQRLYFLNGKDASTTTILRMQSQLDIPGDINGDGQDDVLVNLSGGSVAVLFGRQDTSDVEWGAYTIYSSDGGDGSEGFRIGVPGGIRFGEDVAGVGDVNGDGLADFTVGYPDVNATGTPSSSGLTLLSRGKTSYNSYNFLNVNVDLIAVSGTFFRGTFTDEDLGTNLSNLGDIDGDARNDFYLKGACVFDSELSNKNYFVYSPAPYSYSKNLTTLGAGEGFLFTNSSPNFDTLCNAAGVGDVNGDGLDDFVIGGYSTNIILVFGSSTRLPATVTTEDLVQTYGMTIDPDLDSLYAFASPTMSAHKLGDFNGDGIDDFYLGSRDSSSGDFTKRNQGYVVFGRTSFVPGITLDLAVDIPDMDGNAVNGVRIRGTGGTTTLNGVIAATGGDINNDGYSDLVLGRGSDELNSSSEGLIYVVYGGPTVSDDDNDGVANDSDNCLIVANADQRDTNGDGYGNLCDPDLDNNGIVNFLDVSMFAMAFGTSNPDADLNGDGNVNFLDFSIGWPSFHLGPPGPSGVAP